MKDGNGRVVEHHVSGAVSEEGEYRDGYKEGYWYGRHPNGDMYFEENYYNNRLVNGRSRNLQGDTFVYDESSLYPLPQGGVPKLREYIQSAVRQPDLAIDGTVRLSFRVTEKGKLTDFKVLQSVSRIADDRAKQILRDGPSWIPAKIHGHIKVDGFGYAEVAF